MIEHLIRKDWSFNRNIIVGALVLGAISLAGVAMDSQGAFYIGSTAFITVVIGLGILLVFMTVIQERKAQTLPFVMSLPISAMQYTTAKVLANLLIFLVPWTALTVSAVLLILGREGLPDGLIPFTAIMLLELFAAYCCLLAVAIVSESETWTIVAMVTLNLFFNVFLYAMSHVEGIGAHMQGASPVWNAAVWWALAGSLAAATLCLAATFYLQSRKTDFL
jgi:ABC-type transport system involved in multi-copper enzyme maturation permease subunit